MKTLFLAGLMMLSLLPNAAPLSAQQDATFRLMNLERRCDQLERRNDALERLMQNQALAGANDPYRELMIDMQRQQLSFQQQILTMQQQQLEMKKTIDAQTLRLQELEKRANEKPAIKATPTPTPRQP
jgi:hypothetical protein